MPTFPAANHWGTAVLNSVTAYTRHIAGTAGFGTATFPTLAEVYAFLDDSYFEIATMLTSYGYSQSQTGSAVMGVLSSLQAYETALKIELTQPASTTSDEGNDRFKALKAARDRLTKLIENDGLARLGADKLDPRSGGIVATGVSRSAKLTRYENTDTVQPRFRRGFGQDPALGGDITLADE